MSNMAFTHQLTTTLHDIDAAGVMFFAHYFRYAHDAYEAFMAKIGFSLVDLISRRSMLPLVHSEADFLLPVRHGEQLNISLQLERIGTTSFTIRYIFFDHLERECVRLKTTHVMLSPEDGKPMTLPAGLRCELTGYAA